MRRSSGTKPMPARATRYDSQPVMSTPLKATRPAWGGLSPMIERMVVDLPTPLRPSRQMHSPAPTSIETPNSTRDSPYAVWISRTSSSGAFTNRRGGPRHGPPASSSEGGYAPLGLPRPSRGRAPAQPGRASGLPQDVSSIVVGGPPQGPPPPPPPRAPPPPRGRARGLPTECHLIAPHRW